MLIPINKIVVGERIRKNINSKKVQAIAESIKQLGRLINPIYVNEEADGTYKLVAGMHRLEATKLNGEKEIEATLTNESNPLIIEMAEIDENLMRNDLHYLERGEHLAKRKQIYEQLHPQVQGKGQNYLNNMSDEIISLEPKVYTEDVAKKLNVSQRTVQNEIQIAQNLIPEAKQLIKDKDVGKVEAIELARMNPDEQRLVTQKMEETGIQKVKTAINELRKDGVLKEDTRKDSLQEDLKELINLSKSFEKQLNSINTECIPEEQKEYIFSCLQEVLTKLQELQNRLKSKKD